MKFFLSLWNHHPSTYEIVLDIVHPVIAGLRDLGFRAEHGRGPPRLGWTNIVLENFQYVRIVKQILPYDFVILATEMIDGGGFTGQRHWRWQQRWENFLKIAPHARAIWVLCDGGVEPYKQFAPAVPITLGWSPSLEPTRHTGAPAFDLCAFGNMRAEHRRRALETLSARLRVGTTELSSQADRDAILAQSLFTYGFRPPIDVRFASISRIVASLMHGVPVIQERVAEPSPFVAKLETVEGPDELLARWDELRARREEILARELEAWRAVRGADVLAPAIAAMAPRTWSPLRTLAAAKRSLFPNRGYGRKNEVRRAQG